MPQLRPFRGVRYAEPGVLKHLVCPPYDVISPEEQKALHDRHPHNAVRLELASGPEKYRNSAATFARWLDEGVLARDPDPALYVYRQDFVAPEGARRSVTGIIGALDLEPFGRDSGVLPHERTLPGPIEDRLELLRANPVNVSPIYAIYRGHGEVSGFFAGLDDRPVDARAQDDEGTLHRLWRVTAAAEIARLARSVERGPLVIADGHHRYETALANHRERSSSPGEHDAIMCFCVDVDAEALVVLPYNRVLDTGDVSDADRVQKILLDELDAAPIALELHDEKLAGSKAAHAFVFVLDDAAILVEVDGMWVRERTGERAPAWQALDVVALHEALLPELFPKDSPEFTFTKDPGEVVELVRKQGSTAGVLLRAVHPAQIVDVARSGERMPQKASYFWPKAVTGLVFRPLD